MYLLNVLPDKPGDQPPKQCVCEIQMSKNPDQENCICIEGRNNWSTICLVPKTEWDRTHVPPPKNLCLWVKKGQKEREEVSQTERKRKSLFSLLFCQQEAALLHNSRKGLAAHMLLRKTHTFPCTWNLMAQWEKTGTRWRLERRGGTTDVSWEMAGPDLVAWRRASVNYFNQFLQMLINADLKMLHVLPLLFWMPCTECNSLAVNGWRQEKYHCLLDKQKFVWNRPQTINDYPDA